MSEIDKRIEAEIIRRINEDDGTMSQEEYESLMEDLAVIQFANTFSREVSR